MLVLQSGNFEDYAKIKKRDFFLVLKFFLDQRPLALLILKARKGSCWGYQLYKVWHRIQVLGNIRIGN
jgi:hypothetical protein